MMKKIVIYVDGVKMYAEPAKRTEKPLKGSKYMHGKSDLNKAYRAFVLSKAYSIAKALDEGYMAKKT